MPSVVRGLLQRFLASIGDVLITCSVLIALYLAYLFFWTSTEAHAAAHANVCTLRQAWAKSVAVEPRDAQPFATLQLPQLQNPSVWPVLDGVVQAELMQGVGWYPGTQLPGQVGNFAVAAHRRTWGDIFLYLDQVKIGDTVIVQDGNTTYTYRIIENPVYVTPTATGVLDPIPAYSGLTQTGRYITLTTCDPVYGSYRRLIVFGSLESVRTVQQTTDAC